MAGAAQVIGWILTIDDTDLNSKLAGIQTNVSQVQDVLGDIVTEAIKPAVSILEDIRDLAKEMSTTVSEMLDPDTWKKISKEVSAIKTDVGEMTDAVKETVEEAEGAEILTKTWVGSVKDLFKTISWGVIKGIVLFIPKTIKFVVTSGVKLLAIAKDLAILGFVIGAAVKTSVGLVMSIATLAPRLVLAIGKTVIGSVANVAKSVFGILRKGISGLAKFASAAIGTALGPIWVIAKFLTEGLKKAIGPVFTIANEFLGAMMFMLKPLFMAFRIMLIPFVLLMMPLLVAGVIFIVKKLVDGWKWLWENGLENVWLYISSGKGIAGWWANFKQGWIEVYEGLGIKDLWLWISGGKGIDGWWSRFKGGWKVAWEDSGMKALWEWISGGKGIDGWWSRMHGGWNILWKEFGLKAIYDWFTDTAAWAKWWDDMKKGWDSIWWGITHGIEVAINWIRSTLGKMIHLIGTGIWNAAQGASTSTVKPIQATGILMQTIGHKIQQVGFDLTTPVKLGEGAVVTGPTIALLGEAGTEVVLPLMTTGGAAVIGPEGASGTVSSLPAGFSVENLMKMLADMRDFLSRIVDNTEDQGWINDSDFNAQRDRDAWEA